MNRDSVCNCDMDVSDGKAEGVASGAKHNAELKNDDKYNRMSEEKAEGKHASHMDDKKIDDDISLIYEKGWK